MYDNHIIKDRLNSKNGVVFQPPSKKPEGFVSLYEKMFPSITRAPLVELCPIRYQTNAAQLIVLLRILYYSGAALYHCRIELTVLNSTASFFGSPSHSYGITRSILGLLLTYILFSIITKATGLNAPNRD